MKRKIKRKTTEYYVSGQKKMVVEYRGDWNSGEFIVKKPRAGGQSINIKSKVLACKRISIKTIISREY